MDSRTNDGHARRKRLWLILSLGAATVAIAVALVINRPQAAVGAGAATAQARPTTQTRATIDPGWAVTPAPLTDTQPLDCRSCHNKTLTYHDQLGKGSAACWSCHVSSDSTMNTWHRADGTPITPAQYSELCGQCHQKRYAAWQQGTHGIPGTVAAVPCVTCHNPHNPQAVRTGLTKPQPEPLAVVSASLPTDSIMIVGVSVAILLILAVIYARRKEVL